MCHALLSGAQRLACAFTPAWPAYAAPPAPTTLRGCVTPVRRRLRRPQEFGGGLFRRLPKRVKNGVRDCGLCHYLAVFKQKDGSLVQVRPAYHGCGASVACSLADAALRAPGLCQLYAVGTCGNRAAGNWSVHFAPTHRTRAAFCVQFDFGPRGGDIHVARGPFAFLSKSADGKMQRLVPGEVRQLEKQAGWAQSSGHMACRMSIRVCRSFLPAWQQPHWSLLRCRRCGSGGSRGCLMPTCTWGARRCHWRTYVRGMRCRSRAAW